MLRSVEDQMSIPEVKLQVAVVLISGKNFEGKKILFSGNREVSFTLPCVFL